MNFIAQTLELQMDFFEGPLAVLVNLIKKNKIDVFDIPIGWITERFLEYVDVVREMNLRIAEDFIEMASLLIFIKSRMLLPIDGEDPREELVEKIIEYEKIRAMVRSFDAFPVLGRDTFVRNTAIVEEEDADILSLCTLFFQLMKEREERFIVIQEIRPTLEEKLAQIKTFLAQDGVFTWKMSLEQEMRDKVATVLAILEITKLKMAHVSQKRPFGTIILRRR
ncbi:MAG TPA: segregation/condensation protein A [Spirochaetia bacterium]|nr:segregation/condensation protein A [Spirochaetia bacterium]